MDTMFGTDGIRGKPGEEWLSPRGIYAIGHAIAYWTQQNYTHPILGVATDTRASRHMITSQLYTALSLYESTIIDHAILPTPGLIALAQKHTYTCSIMITASHNAYTDNGIKIFGPVGEKLSQDTEMYLTELAKQAYTHPEYFEQETAFFKTMTCAHYIRKHDALSTYKHFLLHRCAPDLTNKRIVLDAAAGATHHIAPLVLRACGAEVIPIAPTPDGYNINATCGSTHPRTLQEAVIQNKADCGFAFDGDGDRVIAANTEGTIKDGDDILAMLLDHPAYRLESHCIGTDMSNMGLEEYCSNKNITFVRTKVGDKYVANALSYYDAHIGGEASGHIILSDMHSTGDGLLTTLRLLETMQTTHNWKMKSISKYVQVIENIPVSKKYPLEETPLRDIIHAYKTQIDGRIVTRYSGTEPVLRIMIESKNTQQAHSIGYNIRNDILQQLGTL